MTPKTLTIRAAEADDDEAVSSLLHQLGYDVSRAEVRRRLTLPGLAQRVLVAVLAERIVGLIAYTDPIERLAEGTTFVRITAIVVDEACRKDGVGGDDARGRAPRARRRRGPPRIDLRSSRKPKGRTRILPAPRLRGGQRRLHSLSKGPCVMMVVVFRSRVRPEIADKYYALADEMAAIARTMPGFISYKAYFAQDGERVSIHEWETAAQLKAWREHPDHVKAQARGRADFYEEYTLYVADNPRESRFKRK